MQRRNGGRGSVWLACCLFMLVALGPRPMYRRFAFSCAAVAASPRGNEARGHRSSRRRGLLSIGIHSTALATERSTADAVNDTTVEDIHVAVSTRHEPEHQRQRPLWPGFWPPGRPSQARNASLTLQSVAQRVRPSRVVAVLVLGRLLHMVVGTVFSRQSVQAVETIRTILRTAGIVDGLWNSPLTDVVASLIALSRLQQLEPNSVLDGIASEQPFHERHTPALSPGVTHATLIHDLAHYAVYAHAAYGWSMDLATRRRLHLSNTDSLLRQANLSRADVVVAHWHTDTTHRRPAYFVVRDHAQRAIVLGIRGTWSTQDVLTDLCCTSQDFDIDSNDADAGDDTSDTTMAVDTSRSFQKPSWIRQVVACMVHAVSPRPLRRCHVGMLQAARAVQRECQSVVARELAAHPHYTLVLVGHSLGGGCAAILATLWERRYPNAKVFCYGAPCVAPAGARLQRHIVSVVTRGDPFAHWSLGHVVDVSNALTRLCRDPLLRHDILWRTNVPLDAMPESDVQWCRATMESLRRVMTAEKLYPPGRILLLSVPKVVPTKHRRFGWMSLPIGFLNNPHESPMPHIVERPVLRDVGPTYFRELVVAPRMMDVSQHVPTRYISALRALAEVYALPNE